jgi:hypothetical protein
MLLLFEIVGILVIVALVIGGIKSYLDWAAKKSASQDEE